MLGAGEGGSLKCWIRSDADDGDNLVSYWTMLGAGDGNNVESEDMGSHEEDGSVSDVGMLGAGEGNNFNSDVRS
jgi:hypothetical protein